MSPPPGKTANRRRPRAPIKPYGFAFHWRETKFISQFHDTPLMPVNNNGNGNGKRLFVCYGLLRAALCIHSNVLHIYCILLLRFGQICCAQLLKTLFDTKNRHARRGSIVECTKFARWQNTYSIAHHTKMTGGWRRRQSKKATPNRSMRHLEIQNPKTVCHHHHRINIQSASCSPKKAQKRGKKVSLQPVPLRICCVRGFEGLHRF